MIMILNSLFINIIYFGEFLDKLDYSKYHSSGLKLFLSRILEVPFKIHLLNLCTVLACITGAYLAEQKKVREVDTKR